MAAGNAIDRQDGINTKNFYIELGTAQVCICKIFILQYKIIFFLLYKINFIVFNYLA